MINDTTILTSNIKTPIKVALVGLTMIQQALLKFYFATQEGAQRYVEVLGKDADAYITNFDEQGAIEAWENLYSQENKPTLVLSDCRKTVNHYLYFPRPITPNILIDASEAIHDVLIMDKPEDLMAALDIKIEPEELKVESNKLNEPKVVVNELLTTTSAEHSFDSFLTNKPENSKTDLLSAEPKPIISEITLAPKEKPNKLDEVDIFGEFILGENQIDFSLAEQKGSSDNSSDSSDSSDNSRDSKTNSLLSELELELDVDLKLEEISKQTKPQKKPSTDNSLLSFDSNRLESASPPSREITEQSNDKPDDKLTSSDELQSLLDELNDKKAQPKEQKKIKKTLISTHTKKKEQQRWKQLCGTYSNNDYQKNTNSSLYFKLEETLLPYIGDTVAFTERAECWMELAYKPLSIIINPEDKLVYCNLSLENPLFVQICSKSLLEELIEYLEVDSAYKKQIKDGQLNNKLFTYDLKYFTWSVSLLISHGRLPEGTDLDQPIGITNWLTLSKVERFPYIMQIAAVFNQHYASLNEVTTWMTLPKRYIYAFYNGVLAIDMIDKNAKTSKKKLISRGTNDNNNDSLLKNLLFKKK